MSDIVKSMQDAMKDLKSQADDGFSSDPEEESEDELSFELFKAEDLEEFDGQKINLDPFLNGIAATIDSNNERLARALVGTLNIQKAQTEVITSLCAKVDSLVETIDKIASSPAQTKSALTKGEAAKLSSSLSSREFAAESDPVSTSIEPKSAPLGDFGIVKAHITTTLRKSYDAGVEGRAAIAGDIVRIESVPNGFSTDDMLSMLSPVGKRLVLDSMPEKSSDQ